MAADAGDTGDPGAVPEGDEKPITQEQLNKILAAQKKEIEGRFAGFDEFKSKADQLDALTETAKTDAQRKDDAERALAEAKAELAWRDTLDKQRDVAARLNLDPSMWEYVKGETDDEIEASVKKLISISAPRRTTGLRSGASNDPQSRRERIAEALREVGKQ